MHAALRRVVTPSRSGGRHADLVWLLVAGLFATGVALTALGVSTGSTPMAPVTLHWPTLACLFYLTEVRVLHLRFRREAHSYSLSEVPLVLGLFLSAPADVILGAVLGSGLGLLVHRRPAPVKLAFNVALFLLAPAAAVVVFGRLAGLPDPLEARSWLAAFAATAVSMSLGLLAVNAAIALVQGDIDKPRVVTAIRLGLAIAAMDTCLALVMVTLLWIAPGQVWLLAIPLALVVLAWRSYGVAIATQARRHGSRSGDPVT
jgi:hypothetical protein